MGLALACACSGGREDTAAESGGISTTGDTDDTSDTSGDGTFDIMEGGAEAEATAEGGMGCVETDIMVDVVPWNVMLVLDYSSSMNAGFGLDSRWAALWDAVELLVNDYDELVNLGAMTFPDMAVQDYNSCETTTVEVPVAPANGATILSDIPARDIDTPGNTPTRSGLSVAADHLETLDADVPRAIILVTDGEARCKPGYANEETLDDTVDDFVGQIYSVRGIPTYVLGMALNNTAKASLNDMAEQGGVPNPNGPEKYYQADDETQLHEAFDAIGSQVISCEIELEAAPNDPMLLQVLVDGMEWPHVDDCATEDGWVFVEGSGNLRIELCGMACTDFKASGVLKAIQQCPPAG
jgi:hypothetical protein